MAARLPAALREIEKLYLDTGGQPKPGAAGYAIWRGYHDERGRVVEEFFDVEKTYFDLADQPVKPSADTGKAD